MSIAVRLSAAFKLCRSLLPMPLLLASAGLLIPVHAQTPPTLLPHTVSVVAGGGTQPIASGATCPVSGLTATDSYGDGCLATEIQLTTTSTAGSGPRYAIADKTGAIFFSDGTNGLVRRIDPTTGIVTAVAGGASSSPASGNTCGAHTSTDARGDGCLATAVHLSHPEGLTFDANGNLYFADSGQYDVREIAATGGLITTTGIISNVAGYAAGAAAYGYVVSNGTTAVNAATQSYLDAPYGLAFDSLGDLFIAEEYKTAILAVNTNASGSTTVNGVTMPAGSIWKIVGASSTSSYAPYCPNGTSGTFGCNYDPYTEGAAANSTFLDSPYGVAVDPSGNLYIANEYNQVVPVVSPSGILTTFAGNQNSYGKTLMRGPAGSFGIGSDFGITSDTVGDVYITDALNGVVWRVDVGSKAMYPVAGGAQTVCAAATDTYGDGCPALQATFGSSGTSYASTTLPAPGIFGVTVDAYSNLYVGDTETALIREIASGAQFGNVGADQATSTLDIHFAAGDNPASNAYTLTDGAANFLLGSATCTTNSDATVDCLLPVTATPTALGQFTGTLTVTSALGATAVFPLSGNYVQSPETRTSVSVTNANAAGCGSTNTYGTNTQLTLTARVASSGSPTGTITFYSNGTQIGTPQNVSNSSASMTYTFSTAGTYTITATYSGDSYFTTSTGKAPSTITSTAPNFTAAAGTSQQSTVVAGQTALYNFTLTQNVYSGTISFACSGLPANSSCSFSPSTITATGCSTKNTVAMSINTQQGTPVKQSGFGLSGHGPWTALGAVPCVLFMLILGLRRRRTLQGHLWLVLALLVVSSGLLACGKGVQSTPATPSGSYTITVTATGGSGSPATFTVPLKVE